jgi:hypothetical protein
MEEDLAWLLAHPHKRARIRRAVLGEFWQCHMDMKGDRWVLVVFEPEYAGRIGYNRIPPWDERLSAFCPAAPAASYEIN